ncbi:unnamed protein product [Rotaria socialis]|uniref:Fucosyltransferase n=2 Tax=Rotaria socialis TaxID=392032 RepID=A0A818CUD0_9BILA|nr:unnamed protein product [Rotaria socialis]CAF3394109.1 unnamed protein product [Rotaria socialis]CAF3431587.1 unnamed protein product [Rotaria socialis]CAF3631442.1 unnamed protein product [Rotaria socialis]CAF3755973.1 unnamed protein product [Rotaria socialis]
MVHVNYMKKSHQINPIHSINLFAQCLIILFKKYSTLRYCFVICFLLISMIYFSPTIYDNRQNNENKYAEVFPTHFFDTNTSRYIPISKFQSPSHRLVLLWTSLFQEYYWHQKAFFNLSTIVSCSAIHKCQFTRDKSKLSQASTVAFHLYDTNRYELLDRRELNIDNQSWVFVTGETPINFYYHNPSFLPYILNQYFDRSISYKYDSPYLIYSPIVKFRILPNETLNLSLPHTVEIDAEHQLNVKSLEPKKKSIVWIVSNCVTFSQREKYVEELKTFIQIDIYGRCGAPCATKNNRQCKMNLNEYYFYLAFENSRCKSYITEKFWNIMTDSNHRIVPIVMGAPEDDYKRMAPKQSYIHVDDYKTPQDLAQYLHHLIDNPKKYLQYLQWREYTKIELRYSLPWAHLLCPLCQMAYDNPLSSTDRLNFSSWYNAKAECHPDDVKMFKKCKQTNLRAWMNMIHGMKCP